jgi:hypothetical protein
VEVDMSGHRVALLGLLVGCASVRNVEDPASPTSAQLCSPESLDRANLHREVSLNVVAYDPDRALATLSAALQSPTADGRPGARIQYQSSSPGYANATFLFPAGSSMDGLELAKQMEMEVQSSNVSDSDYGPQIADQCDRLRLLETASEVLGEAVLVNTIGGGRRSDALLAERELNLRERQSLAGAIRSLVDQAVWDRVSITITPRAG